ncbi:MAG TPA: hypothetical protein VFQ58_03275, partial [Flavisolibacter sp.]|nr:hypothetical protein [Flavisolibacter sp.]
MKKIILGFLLLSSCILKAQVYNNEWIDYSKTYYKFKIGVTGLYRIPQSLLASAGMGSTPAEYFQLWRNGAQVPLYITTASGQLSNSDYIEFWAEANDGKPDKPLYRDPSYQICDKYSLESDTAVFFLTANPVSSNNLRLVSTPNNVAGNSLPVEPYFMYTLGNYPRQKMNPGIAVNVGEYMYSSSYDKGEMLSSLDMDMNTSVSYTFPGNLYIYPTGPNPKFKVGILGNAINARRYTATINNDSIIGKEVDYFNFALDSTTFNLSTLASNTATVNITNLTQCITPPNCPAYDAMDIISYEITYPRKFDFGGSSNFEFYLPATALGNYIEI